MKLIMFYLDTRVSRIFVETEENGVKSVSLSSPHNFFYRDEIIAKVIDVDKPEDAASKADHGYSYFKVEPYFSLKIGDNIYYDENSRTYRASKFGFGILDKTKTLRLLSTVQLSKDKTRAFLIIFPTKTQRIPSVNDVDEILKYEKILASADHSEIEKNLGAIKPGERTVTKLKIAQSKSPVIGRKEYFMPLFDIQKKSGRMMSDGRIDFREQDAIIQVSKGQEILQRFPEIKQEDGFDIYGQKIEGGMEEPQGYLCGSNIYPSQKDENIYISSIDGCLDIDKRNISVVPVVVVRGDVDYSTGNIDFNGSVQIKGSVLPGFAVKARGDIIVGNNVDDASLDATGDITVGMGIAGKGSSKIRAAGNLKAKYILNSNVEVAGSISVEDSIINSTVFSNDGVAVTSPHGKILGGEIIARHDIKVNFAGTQSETPTILTVGKNLAVERELQEIRKQMVQFKSVVDDIMAKIKASFGNNLFEDPKKFIAILPPVKRKACLELLAELTKNNNELKKLALLGIKTEEKMVFDREPMVIVPEKTYRGVVINIKKRTRKIEQEIANAKFFEDNQDKTIRFVQAN
jgi:uncharacterized protein (DUF342 family)